MKHKIAHILTTLLALTLGACTTQQQQRLLAATETAALTALEYKARGASGEFAASSGIVAGLIAYKTPPARPAPAAQAEITSSK